VRKGAITEKRLLDNVQSFMAETQEKYISSVPVGVQPVSSKALPFLWERRLPQKADLLVLRANPLVDVRNVAKRDAVILNGRWLPQTQLEKMLNSPLTMKVH
jgi:hypothetical protein